MPRDSLTFELGGPIEIGKLESGLQAFHRLIRVLTPDTANIRWIVDELGTGSAVATIRGEADDTSQVEEVVIKYEHIGAALQEGSSLSSFGQPVSKAADKLREIAGTVTYVRLATSNDDFIFSANGGGAGHSVSSASIGSVTGRIETVSSRRSLRFNLYDLTFDKAVTCYLAEGQEDLMREAWGKRARVNGLVHRESMGGRPISVRRISKVEILTDIEPGSFRQAKGAVPWQPDFESGEVVLRRLRDA